MKRHKYLSVFVLLALVLVPLAGPLAAQDINTLERAPNPDSKLLQPDLSHPAFSPQPESVPALSKPALPSQASWQYGPPSSFQYQRFDGVFVPGPDGESWANKVYFMGGRISAPSELPDIWVFDPLTELYADTQADMIEDVSNYNANLILDDGTGRGPAVYVIGGYDKDGGSGGGNIPTVQRYYPTSNVIEALPPADDWTGQVGGITVGGMGTAVVNDVIYVFGGWQSSTAPYFYAGTWTLDPKQTSGSRWTDLGIDLAVGRSYLQYAVQAGKVYAMGGIDQYVGGDLGPTNVVEVLDTNDLPAGWTSLAPMPVAMAEGRGFGFDDDTMNLDSPWQGSIYVAGGGDWPDTSLEVMEYDIATDTWNQAFADLNEDRVNHAGVFIPLCTPDPNDGLPGMWVFGGRWDNGCDPPYGPTEFYPMPCASQCDILLVDDDWDFDQTIPNDGGRPYYTLTLDYMGYAYDLWDTVAMSTPTSLDLASYDLVLWFTGYDWQTPISPTEELALTTYLDNGGKLLMSSQEQEYAFPGSTIMSDYFWVDSVTEDVVMTNTMGSPSDPLFSALGPYPMARPDQWATYWPTDTYEGPYDDEVFVKVGGYEPMIYTDSGNPNSTRYDSGDFMTLYLGYPFEWLPNLEDRVEVMGTALSWFACDPHCIKVTGLAITGTAELLTGETGTYTVTLEPAFATEPLSIEWSNGMTGTVASYSWSEAGDYTVTVTATNCSGMDIITDTFDVTVIQATWSIYLPIVVKH